MELNKDGLEPGQEVDFATLQRIKRTHKAGGDNGDSTDTKGKGRKGKVRAGAVTGVASASLADAPKEAKKG